MKIITNNSIEITKYFKLFFKYYLTFATEISLLMCKGATYKKMLLKSAVKA
ncbi:hypothetical protein RV01_GL001059 [Enterococcus dispar]|nr:hypothetical protein RV01_GL001059 [Enterococcus dispar]